MKNNKTSMVILMSIIFYLGFGVMLLLIFGFSDAGVRITIRATSKISLILFTLIFIASPLNILRPSNFSHWLLKQRKNIGIIFGVSFLISHLMLIYFLYYFNNFDTPDRVRPIDIYEGGLGLVFLFAMLVTSFEKLSSVTNPRIWKFIHTIGLYYVWIIFTFDQVDSYLIKVPPARAEYYIPFIIIMIFSMGIRLTALYHNYKKVKKI